MASRRAVTDSDSERSTHEENNSDAMIAMPVEIMVFFMKIGIYEDYS